MKRRHTVLVVDDSAFARKVIREVLSSDPRLEVVGFARDGLDALEKITELKPDVVTLDLVMPELDGLGFLEAISGRDDKPRVVIVTMSDAESALGVNALEAGAIDIVHKPTALATDRLYELRTELIEKVVQAATSSAPRALMMTKARPAEAPLVRSAQNCKLVVLGTSTGGPRAITDILRKLPGSFPVPIAIVVHMPAGYTEAFARRLDEMCSLHVQEASENVVLEPGSVVIGRAGSHFGVRRRLGKLVADLDARASTDLYRPSVDALFESAARELHGEVLGVVLTGMGTDGLAGARAIHAAGGHLIAEAESSCVVYGMPRAVAEAGLGAKVVPLELVARTLLESV